MGNLKLSLNLATLPTCENDSLIESLEKPPLTSHLPGVGFLPSSKPITNMELELPD